MAGGVVIVAGFGFRATAEMASFEDGWARAAPDGAVDLMATAADKAGHPGLTALAARLGLRIVGLGPEALAAQRVVTVSEASVRARGTGSVAEAAALAAAGPGGRLLGPRVVSSDGRVTCALAEGAAP